MAKKSSPGGKRCLVIVESPTKEKTISRFLDSEYLVKSSYGHVRDLPEGSLGVDEKKSFAPTYVLLPRAKKIVQELNEFLKNSKVVFLATDPDREGESIAWHITKILEAEDYRFKRIVFHEITRKAIQTALKEPRDIDLNLVHAQQARRIIDRLVGYKLSPLLWSKVARGLSAGRVQSVTVRLVAERAAEIEKFIQEDYYTIAALFKKDALEFEARLVKWHSVPVEETITLYLFSEDYKYRTSVFKKLEDTVPAATYLRNTLLKVLNVESKTSGQKPRPPFITSTLQQDAYGKLGYSSDRTMRIAQSLYEGVNLQGEMTGLITYMRTDSFNVSQEIQKQSAKFISETYGSAYCPAAPPLYHTKVKGAQEAHEAIHPVNVYLKPQDIKEHLTLEQFKLYDLIWKRFMASQMEDAVFDVLTVEIGDDQGAALLRASGRTVKFDGYRKVYTDEFSEEDAQANGMNIPKVVKGEELNIPEVSEKAHKTSPPPYYNEASLIRTLEKHGIGRPSTYAVIVKTVLDRGYLKREPKDKRLMITELGKLVTAKLKDFFPDIMDVSYTASIEDKLDEIAEGKHNWTDVVRDFYNPFVNNLSTAEKKMEVSKPEPVKTNEKCPVCGKLMVLRESRYGKYLSCSMFPKCRGKIPLDKDGNKREVFHPIPAGKVCSKCNKNAMLLRKGVRGFFIACSGFPRCRNIEKVTPEEVERIINSK
ncbi:MAG: type I DNA topoisomerase [Elusimicrobia bacterium]|nr:type I DNA topoisomerase [Elusimicrobiota bacterium]